MLFSDTCLHGDSLLEKCMWEKIAGALVPPSSET